VDAGTGLIANLLVTPAQLAGDRVPVAGEPYRHLFRARRLTRDARLRVVDGAGRARWAEVVGIDRERAELRLLDEAPANDPVRCVELLVATPRPERAAWLVEKATELGVFAVRFLASERAVRGVDGKALERLGRVARAALEQSGGARLPELSGPHALDEVPRMAEKMPGLAHPGGALLLLDPAARQSLSSAAEGPPHAVLVGPEGGWSDGERAALVEAGATAVSLGVRVLRLETAAVAAAALLLVPR
jgi:16S rRNA (uracil1498-N3)-methyltransferase